MPEAPEIPPGARNSVVMPPITWGTTAKGLKLTTADEVCEATASLRQAVKDNLSAPYEHLLDTPLPSAAGAPVLSIEVTDILANGGGVYGGPKIVEIRGTLSRTGAAPLRFEARRSTFLRIGGWNTTCGMVSRVTYALGTDVAQWLDKPVDGVRIGEY